MALTPFQAYLSRSDFVEAGMNDLDILLPGTRKRAIGTRNLNGCTAIAILGNALLVAHIFPRGDPKSPGEEHLKRHLSSIISLYTQYENHFLKYMTTWAFFGTLGGSLMRSVVETVKTHLSRAGLLVQPKFYQVAPANTRGLSAGEMLAAIRGNEIELFLERNLVEKR